MENESIVIKRSIFFAALLPILFILGLATGYVFWGLQPWNTTQTENIVAVVEETDNASEKVSEGGEQVSENPEEQAEDGQSGESQDAQSENQEQEKDQQSAETQQPIRRYEIPVDGDPVLGSDEAAITLIEFSDYQCPYCQKWHAEVFPRIVEAYGDKVRIVYRDFPLQSIHGDAVSAAEAANCAYEQGDFWEYHELLFAASEGLGQDSYRVYAEEIGLDLDEFDACMEENRYTDEVMADLEFASQIGVRSTPTFFLNGIAVVGAQPYEVFKEIIDRELAGELE